MDMSPMIFAKQPQRRRLNQLGHFSKAVLFAMRTRRLELSSARIPCAGSTAQYDWLRSVVMRDKLFAVVFKISGRSAAWLARLVRDQEAGGSNPLAPTTLFISNDLQCVAEHKVA
jgi:hypothetical protein